MMTPLDLLLFELRSYTSFLLLVEPTPIALPTDSLVQILGRAKFESSTWIVLTKSLK